MNYPNYQTCKDSGVNWLGNVPIHWDIVPIKFSLSIPITDGPHETPKLYNDGVPFLSAEAVKEDRLDFSKKRGFISQEEHERFSKKYKPKSGDVYMVKSGATTGNVTRVETEKEFNIWSPLAAIRPDGNLLTTDFIFYFMKSSSFFYSVELSWSYGTQQNIGMGVIANLKMARPPVEEQIQIGDYLNYKTTQIDRLIEKKKALIEKLNEQRIAVITQAVTKGLNSDVPMKDSEVEWLGGVPEHWEVLKLRFLGECQNGINIGGESFGRGFPFVSYGDVYNNRELPKEVKGLVESSETDRRLYSVQSGDLFFTRTSETVEEIAMTSVCMNTIEDSVFAGFLIRFRPNQERLLKEFSKYYFQNALLRAFFVKEMNLVTRASLSQELLKNLPVLLPPEDEQKKIASYLVSETAKINRMVEINQQTIEKLEEYRIALITAAVTGEIDVRDVDLPEDN